MNTNSARTAAVTAESSDLELARHAARGDERAFEIIMRRNNRALFRAARSILRNDAEAEDAVPAAGRLERAKDGVADVQERLARARAAEQLGG